MRSLFQQLTFLEQKINKEMTSFMAISSIKCPQCQRDYFKPRYRQYHQLRYSVCDGTHLICKPCYKQLIKNEPSYFLTNKCSCCMSSYKTKENMAQIPVDKIKFEKKLFDFIKGINLEIIKIREDHSQSYIISFGLEDSNFQESSILSQLPPNSNIVRQEKSKKHERPDNKWKLQKQKSQHLKSLVDDLLKQNRQLKKELQDQKTINSTYTSCYQKALNTNAQDLQNSKKNSQQKEERLKYQVETLSKDAYQREERLKQQINTLNKLCEKEKLKLLEFQSKNTQNLKQIARLDAEIKSKDKQIEQTNKKMQDKQLRRNRQQHNEIAQRNKSIQQNNDNSKNIKNEVAVNSSIPSYLKQKIFVLILETIINLLLIVVLVEKQDQAKKLSNSGSPKLQEHLVALTVLLSFKLGGNALLSIIKFSSFIEELKKKYHGALSCHREIIIYIVTHFLHPTLLMASLNKEQLKDRNYPIVEIIFQVIYSLVQLSIILICFTIYWILDAKVITVIIMVLGSVDFVNRCLKCLRSTLSPLISLIQTSQNAQVNNISAQQNQFALNVTQDNMEIDVTRNEFAQI